MEEFGLRRSRKNKWRFGSRECGAQRGPDVNCGFEVSIGVAPFSCVADFLSPPALSASAVRHYGLAGVRAFAWPPGPCGGRAGMAREKT